MREMLRERWGREEGGRGPRFQVQPLPAQRSRLSALKAPIFSVCTQYFKVGTPRPVKELVEKPCSKRRGANVMCDESLAALPRVFSICIP
jgi:hypothetical protein